MTYDMFPETAGREVRGTRLRWRTIREWIALAHDLGNRIESSTPHYRRVEALYRSLTADDIRRCNDAATLRRLLKIFERPYRDYGWFWPPWRAYSRAELGEVRLQVHNRLIALERGDRHREKGPRLDPSRLPDAALDRLIQSHKNLDLVERLRAERNRRAAMERSDEHR